MALWVCSGEGGCGTKYAVGLSRCPRCHNTEFHEDGAEPVAKISKHGGASDGTPPPEPDVEADETAADTEPGAEEAPAVEAAPEPEGGEEPSPGSSSETSTEKPSTQPEPSEPPLPKRARKTASRSAQAPTGSSSARGTDGDQTEATSASDGPGSK
jgi:hypothetical protein